MGVAIAVTACFVLGVVFSIPHESGFDNSTHSFSYTLVPPGLYQEAIETAGGIKRTGASTGIVAHHLLVADKIAQTFASLGTGKEKTVVILSPNHFKLGESFLQSTDGTWETEFGNVEVDTKLLADLMNEIPELAYQPATFQMEHGVSSIVPFVKVFFPHAKILPIAIGEGATNHIELLAEAILKESPQAIIVSSIDMSHNLPQYVSGVHDEMTLQAIAAGTCVGECRLCLLYTSPSPRDRQKSRMPSSA